MKEFSYLYKVEGICQHCSYIIIRKTCKIYTFRHAEEDNLTYFGSNTVISALLLVAFTDITQWGVHKKNGSRTSTFTTIAICDVHRVSSARKYIDAVTRNTSTP